MQETEKYFAPAKKSLGQNFLIDKNICRRIVAALAPTENDLILEIGPGRGALTEFLVQSDHYGLQVLEKDKALAAILARKYPDVQIIEGDALSFDWNAVQTETLKTKSLKFVGNLPYNIASRLIWDIVSIPRRFERAVFMVQHEVALRLCAASGSRQYGALSVWVQAFCTVDYLFKVPPTVFRPQPKVNSAVLCFRPLHSCLSPIHSKALSDILKLCFQKRRKQLKNIFKEHAWELFAKEVGEIGILPSLRPEALSVQNFIDFAAVFAKFFS